MSRTLDEAIRHEMNIAEKQEELAKVCIAKRAKDDCLKCAVEHRQLAEWLKELAERRKQSEVIRCGECRFNDGTAYCDFHFRDVKDTDYCSWSERRTDEQPD